MFEKFKIYAMSPNLEFRYDSECGISIQHRMWNSVVKQQRVPPACDQVYRQNSDRKPDRGTKLEFGQGFAGSGQISIRYNPTFDHEFCFSTDPALENL